MKSNIFIMEGEKNEYIEEPICTVNGERIVKRYRKLRVVGEGSYSKCWLAQTEGSDSTYVIKVLPKKKLEMLVKEKLVYEIRIHQQLSHPNVVHLDHWFEDASSQYIFLEYCSQGNLEKRLQSRAKMSEKDIRYYVRQVIEALMYIHSKNILHRDLKLCNFYIDSGNVLKLGDFGFACQLAYPNQLKRQTCGTPNYIAPEAVSGFGYSFSADVWGVGVILFRLKFRVCPFEGRAVRQTLEKVKTCQYSFPKGEKISPELKDLIQRVFVINYDDRLTLEQILAHPFFQADKEKEKGHSEAKGFAMIRNIFSREKDSSKKKEEQAKRSNSCETFKQIKEIFKNKSKGTLMTSMGTQFKTQENLGNSTITIASNSNTNRDRFSLANTTMRSVAEGSFSSGLIGKRLQGGSQQRVNNFLGSVKEQMKMQSRLGPPQQRTASNVSQQLSIIAKKHYLPYEVQAEKDVTIVHYKDSIKQVIYAGSAYLLHRDTQPLYDMAGALFTAPPKMLRYIVENKVVIAEGEPQQEQFGVNSIQKILLFVSHRPIALKDGVILRFGPANSPIFVAKMNSQQLFYVGSLTKDHQSFKQDGKISLMYLREGKAYKCAQGVVLSRIYQGWVANAFKNYKQ